MFIIWGDRLMNKGVSIEQRIMCCIEYHYAFNTEAFGFRGDRWLLKFEF